MEDRNAFLIGNDELRVVERIQQEAEREHFARTYQNGGPQNVQIFPNFAYTFRPPLTQFTLNREESNPKKIYILKGFTQQIPIEKYLSLLEGLNGTAASIFAKTPLDSIYFKDLQLNWIEEALKKAPSDLQGPLRSFKNYLLWGKKCPEEEVISLFPGVTSPTEKLGYSLQFNKEFLKKLSRSLWDPVIKIQLIVEGIRQLNLIQNDPSGIMYAVDLPLMGGKEPIQFYFEGEMKASEILKLNQIPLKSLLKSGTELTKTQLLIQKDQKRCLNFTWNVQVELGEKKEGFQLRSDMILESIFNLEGKDVTIVAANGAEIKCHRNILMAQSESFHSMLSPKYGMMEAQTGRIELLENSEEGLLQFVKLLYGFPLPKGITCELALEVFQLANKYGIKELEGFMKEFLCLKGMQFYNPDTILELYYVTRNVESLEELMAHALTEMSTLSEDTLTSCEYFKKLPRDDAESLLFTLLQWKS